MTFLIADGVVPSNEDRGYVLRRIMRRAILQGRSTLQLAPGFLPRYSELVTELMGGEYRELAEQRESVHKWLASEEEGFGRTLEAGSKLLDELIARAVETGAEGISAADAFLLHDTHGFPFDLTLELVAEHGLGVDEEGFESLMEDQRRRARAGAGRSRAGEALRAQAQSLAAEAGFTTDFKGYESTAVHTTVGAVAQENGRLLVKLLESPFYATGGGQVADSGWVECEDGDCLARVDDVLRLGDDQVVALVAERGSALRPESGCSRGSTAPPVTRPRATTPRRTCCTLHCARGSATTCARRAPTSVLTSSGSTSRTAARSVPMTSPTSSGRSTAGSCRPIRYARSARP